MSGWFHGIVVDNNDPEKAGRVRAAIPDLFTDPETGHCEPSPWIEASGGMGPGVGILNVPPVGAPIQVTRRYSSDQNLYQMSYQFGRVARGSDGVANSPAVGKGLDDESASALKAGTPFSIPATTSTVTSDGDLSFGAPTLEMSTQEIPGFPGTTNAGEYPHVRVFKTPGGIVVELDDTPNASRIHVWHPSGSHLEISNEGVRVDQQSAKWERTVANRTSHVGGDDRVAVEGARQASVGGDQLEEVGGRHLLAAAEVAFQSFGSTLIESQGRLTLRAAQDAGLRAGSEVSINSGGTLKTFAAMADQGVTLGTFARTAVEGMSFKVPDLKSIELAGIVLPGFPLVKEPGMRLVLAALQVWMTTLFEATGAAGVVVTEAPQEGGPALVTLAGAIELANFAFGGVLDAALVPGPSALYTTIVKGA